MHGTFQWKQIDCDSHNCFIVEGLYCSCSGRVAHTNLHVYSGGGGVEYKHGQVHEGISSAMHSRDKSSRASRGKKGKWFLPFVACSFSCWVYFEVIYAIWVYAKDCALMWLAAQFCQSIFYTWSNLTRQIWGMHLLDSFGFPVYRIYR